MTLLLIGRTVPWESGVFDGGVYWKVVAGLLTGLITVLAGELTDCQPQHDDTANDSRHTQWHLEKKMLR